MSTIKIRLRFYLPHDMDLISLMISHEMDVVQAMYCAVSAFVKHDSFAIKIPPLRDIPMEKKRIFHKNLSLDSEKDKDVVELLECIEPGYRNNFLKNILRLYIYCPATEAFLTDPEDMKKLEEHFGIFTEGKRIADAATVKARKRKRVESKEKTLKMSESSQPIKHNTEKVYEEPSDINAQPEEMLKEKPSDPRTVTNNKDVIPEPEEEDLTDLFSAILN